MSDVNVRRASGQGSDNLRCRLKERKANRACHRVINGNAACEHVGVGGCGEVEIDAHLVIQSTFLAGFVVDGESFEWTWNIGLMGMCNQLD